ncbi:hypothetical protein ABE29_12330 [Cytobacillus firmus]|nr:hypothetical protein [Cytobacillus firmus]MBG9549415.1 hypothetical protein [Cytobacillus firmus]MBG9554830.1 hypothetical protein [Cytobacillus firmus]MBG9559597.1 hypothetical protein [Cytobacillus firmus]MBG9574730.1 hypothetical protein [Cytobacillus firmus]
MIRNTFVLLHSIFKQAFISNTARRRFHKKYVDYPYPYLPIKVEFDRNLLNPFFTENYSFKRNRSNPVSFSAL